MYRFKWFTCCAFLFMLCGMSPIAITSAAETRTRFVKPKSAPAKDKSLTEAVSLPEPPVSSISPQLNANLPGTLPSVDESRPATSAFLVPVKQGLSYLIGKSEIAVSVDADGQFAKSIAENQLEGEIASQVVEMNLVKSISAGRSFDRDSLASLARADQAKAQTGQAFALLLPSVSVHANYGLERSEPSVLIDATTGDYVASDTHSRADVSLVVRQPLFDLPSFLDWRRRKVIEQARGENYRVSDSDAYVSAVNAYLSLVSSRLQIDMTYGFEKQLAELLSYIEKRASAGAASISDLARVRARMQSTLSSRLEQEAAHAAAGMDFVRLINLVPRNLLLPVPEDVGASLVPTSFEVAVTTAMKSNPDIAALMAEVQAAEMDKSTAKGRFLPRLDGEYTDSWSLHAGGATSSSGQRDRRLMLVANWTPISGGSDYKFHAERVARHRELQYRLDDQRRRVMQTLSANYSTLTTTRERIASGYQELRSISTAAEAMSKRMLSGNQSLLDLLDVYERFYQVRSRLVTLHIQELSTVTQLVRLTVGSSGPISPVATESSTTDMKRDLVLPTGETGKEEQNKHVRVDYVNAP